MPPQDEDDLELSFDEIPPRKWPTLTDLNFWENPADWPQDPPGYVFLARAFNKIGRAIFGDSWTGEECLLNRLLPGTDLGVVVRLVTVRDEIAKRCQIGDLIFATRPIRGGEMTVGPPSWWNTEKVHYQKRFCACQINASDPFDAKGGANSWIYVTRASLDLYFAKESFAGRQLPSHLSPYLKVMLAVVDELLINSSNQPKKEAVMDAIQKRWAKLGHEKLSNSLLGYMATCVREIESGKGGRKRKSKEKG